MTSEQIIDLYDLKKHPEGGHYKRTYQSAISLPETVLPNQQGNRYCQTAIYYLLTAPDVSKFHRLKSDEIWFFHEGNSVILYTIENGKLVKNILGKNIEVGEKYQVMIPAGIWFAAEVYENSGFSFVSCSVAPGFDFNDFELASKQELVKSCSKLNTFDDCFFVG